MSKNKKNAQFKNWLYTLTSKQKDEVLEILTDYAMETEYIAFRCEEVAKRLARENKENWIKHYGFHFTDDGKLLTEQPWQELDALDQELRFDGIYDQVIAIQKLRELGLNPRSYIVNRVKYEGQWRIFSVEFMCGRMNIAMLINNTHLLTVFSQPRPYGLPVPYTTRDGLLTSTEENIDLHELGKSCGE